jgi:hypothetical protein
MGFYHKRRCHFLDLAGNETRCGSNQLKVVLECDFPRKHLLKIALIVKSLILILQAENKVFEVK